MHQDVILFVLSILGLVWYTSLWSIGILGCWAAYVLVLPGSVVLKKSADANGTGYGHDHHFRPHQVQLLLASLFSGH